MKIRRIIKKVINEQIPILISSNCKQEGVALTFDDAYIDAWYSIRELLMTYKAKVTFFVAFFDRLSNDEVEKLRKLRDDGHEIACHGLRHLNAVGFMEKYSIERYIEEEIKPAINIMTSNGFHPLNFSYPYGAHTDIIDNVLLDFFERVRTSSNKNANFFNRKQRIVGAIGIDNAYNNYQNIPEYLKKAKRKKEIIILYGHRTSNEPGDFHTPIDRVEAILKSASEYGLPFYRMSDL